MEMRDRPDEFEITDEMVSAGCREAAKWRLCEDDPEVFLGAIFCAMLAVKKRREVTR